MPGDDAGALPDMSGISSDSHSSGSLEDNLDEPTEGEVREYAEWLGMDMERDEDLLWIAREGLKMPLPAAWRPCESSNGKIFYFNSESGESRWEHPNDEALRSRYGSERSKRAGGQTAATSTSPSAPTSPEDGAACGSPPEIRLELHRVAGCARLPGAGRAASSSKAVASGRPPLPPHGFSLAAEQSAEQSAEHTAEHTADEEQLSLWSQIEEHLGSPMAARSMDQVMAGSLELSSLTAALAGSPSLDGRSSCGAEAPEQDTAPPLPGSPDLADLAARARGCAHLCRDPEGAEEPQARAAATPDHGVETSALPVDAGDVAGVADSPAAESTAHHAEEPHHAAESSHTVEAPRPSAPDPLVERLRAEVSLLAARLRSVEACRVGGPLGSGEPPRVVDAHAGSDASTVRAVRPQRGASLCEAAALDLERLEWEVRQLREEAVAGERLLQEERLALQREQAAHSSSRTSARESRQEVLRLRGDLRLRDAAAERAAAELRACRVELADREAENLQLQLQLNDRDMELGHARQRQLAGAHRADVALRAELRREHLEGHERLRRDERQGQKTGASTRRRLFEEAHRAEHGSPLPAGRPCVAGALPDDWRADACPDRSDWRGTRPGAAGQGAQCPASPPSSPRQDSCGSLAMAPDARPGAAPRALPEPAARALSELLRLRRRELRSEHRDLEGERRRWRAAERPGDREDAGSAEVRTALEARTAALNRSIGEYRALERLLLREGAAAPTGRAGPSSCWQEELPRAQQRGAAAVPLGRGTCCGALGKGPPAVMPPLSAVPARAAHRGEERRSRSCGFVPARASAGGA